MVLYDMSEAQNISGMNIFSVYVRNTRCMMITWYIMLSICQKHKIYMIITWYDMVSICRKHKIYVMIIWYDCWYGNRRPIRALNANRLDHQTISTASPPVEIDFNTIHPYLTHVSETNFRSMHIFHLQYSLIVFKKSIAVECAQKSINQTICTSFCYQVGIDFQLSSVRLGELKCWTCTVYFQMSHQGGRGWEITLIILGGCENLNVTIQILKTFVSLIACPN